MSSLDVARGLQLCIRSGPPHPLHQATVRSLSVIRGGLLAALLLCGGVLCSLAGPVAATPEVEVVYHSRIPLGSDLFQVAGWHKPLAILVSASNAYFEGWRHATINGRRLLLDADGTRVREYPSTVSFRVSAGTRTRLIGQLPYALQTSLDVNDFLLKLRFQLKVFRGLQQTTLPPQAVEAIGVPADVPYDERIYRIRFALPDIPMSDRLVLEVLAPGGERLSKFGLDLY